MLFKTTAFQTLEKTDSAKILIISDSHGSKENLEQAIKKFGSDCAALLFCGDGMEDLVSLIEEDFHQDQQHKFMPACVFFARGNGDDYSIQLATDKISRLSVEDFKIVEAAGKKIFLTHGHLFGAGYGVSELIQEAKIQRCQIAIFGHTHVPYCKVQDNVLLINPGSCTRPRQGSLKSCCVLTIKKDSPQCDCQFFTID